MKTTVHPIKTSARTGTLTITEHPDRLAMVLQLDRYGDCGDSTEIMRQLAPILWPFNTDPRPFEFDTPDLGSKVVVDQDRDGRLFAIISEEIRH